MAYLGIFSELFGEIHFHPSGNTDLIDQLISNNFSSLKMDYCFRKKSEQLALMIYVTSVSDKIDRYWQLVINEALYQKILSYSPQLGVLLFVANSNSRKNMHQIEINGGIILRKKQYIHDHRQVSNFKAMQISFSSFFFFGVI